MDIQEQILLTLAQSLPELTKPQDRLDALTTMVNVATALSKEVYDRHPLNSYRFLEKCGIVRKVDIYALAKQVRKRNGRRK